MDDGDSIEGQEPITLGNIVNPSLFWASYPLGVNRKANYWKHTIDKELKEHFSERRNRKSAYVDDLQLHTNVVIQDPETKIWLRGKIRDKKLNGPKQVFDVFLVDIGVTFCALVADEIYLMPEKFTVYDTQAFLITLYGIEPLSMDLDLVAEKCVLEPSKCWSPNHFHFINALIADSDGAFFKTIKVVNNVKHGVLYFDINQVRFNVNQKFIDSKNALQRDSVVNLNKYLIRNKDYDFVIRIIGSGSKKEKSNTTEASHSKRDHRSTYSASGSGETKQIYSDVEEEVDIATGITKSHYESEGSFYVNRGSKDRPATVCYPAGYNVPNMKKSKTSPVQKPAERENFRRESHETRANSTHSTTHPEPTQYEEWSDEESTVGTCVKTDFQGKVEVTKQTEKVSNDKSLVSCDKTESSDQVETVPPKTSDSKPKPGFLKNIVSFFSRTGGDGNESSSDDSDISDTINTKSTILSLYNNLKNKNSGTNSSASKSTPQPSSVHSASQDSESYSNMENTAPAGSHTNQQCARKENRSIISCSNPSSPHGATVEAVSTPDRNTSVLSSSTPLQNVSNFSTSTQNDSNVSTPIQNFSFASSTSSGGKSRSQREKERLEEFRRLTGKTSCETVSNKKLICDDLSDTTSQSSASQSELNNSENQCNLSVASSNSSRKLLGESSLTDSMSETEDVSKNKLKKNFDDVTLPHKERVLVHDCCDLEIAPIESLKDFQLDPDVKSALSKLNVTSLYRVQSYACPLILEWRDVAIVHMEGAGKSMSYIIPLLSLLNANISYRQLKQTNCPKVVIVCPWSSACDNIAYSFKKILGYFRSDIKVVTAYSSGKQGETEKLIALVNGCDVLITTPRYLLNLFKEEHVLNFGHIFHFILDGCHDLFKYFEPEVLSICKKISAIKAEKKKVQIIAISEVYDAALDRIVQGFMNFPVLLIADAIEAAIYGKSACKFTVTTPENKMQTLLSMLDAFKARGMRTVIVCDEKSVDHVNEILRKENYNSVALLEPTIDDEHIGKSRRSWLRSRLEGVGHPVMVCSDDALIPLNITDAHILIHYDLPPTKTVFSARYFSIFSNIHNRLVKNSEQNYCKTGVIIDTENNVQFPSILEYVKRFLHKSELPSEVEEIAKRISLEKEEEKKDCPLCPRLLKFGECWPSVCAKRHVFINEVDFPQFIPKKGFVKIKLLNRLDASNFSARLLEHSEDSVSWTHHTDNYGVFAAKLNMHFMDSSNKYTKADPVLGDMVVFEQYPSDFKRAVIVEVAPKKRGKPQDFKLKLIDEGLIYLKWVPEPLLLTCPEYFQEDIPYAIDIFVCGLKPVDLDHSWNQYAVNHIWKEILKYQKHEADGYFFIGKIMLALNSSLWLNPFECQQYLESTKLHVTKFSIKQELMDHNYAVKNPDHLSKLYELCNLVELPVPVYEAPKLLKPVKEVEEIKPQWAHLPLDEENRSESCVVNVYITHNDDPDTVYIQQIKFLDRLEKLHEDINRTKKIYPKDWKVGDLCIANFRDEDPDKWFRAEIVEKPSDKEVEVFYVDYGQGDVLSLDQVAKLEPKFITRLPFQAIECHLAAIRPVGKSWDVGAALTIDEFMMDENGIFKTILAKAVQIRNKAKQTGGHRYSVVLREISENSFTINKVLIDRGYAKMWRGQAFFLDTALPFNHADTNTEDEEDDLWEYEASRGAEFSEESAKEQAMKEAFDIEKFCENYTNNFTSDDEEDLKNFAVDFFSKTLDIDPSTLEFERASLPAPPSSSNSKVLMSKESDNKDGDGEGAAADLPPPLECSFRSPVVLWHQNNTHVYLRVQLIGVVDYYLDWGDNYVEFQTELESQRYQFFVTFCGVIDPHKTEHSAKGFYVDIKLKKQLVGTMWPRLTLDTYKLPWLKFNPDFFEDDEEEVPFHSNLRLCSGEGRYGTQMNYEAVPEGLYEDTSDEASLKETEARYNMPDDQYDPMA